ncbi:MAG: hypothetical protein KDD69_19210 [Bdellovibrionales bacterium]|nr:hypothetical protein [Bdellovibrionales bacterium]
MKRSVKRLTLGLATCYMAAGLGGLEPASAQENKTPDAVYDLNQEAENLWLTLSMPFYNKYYYRGIELYSDASFQPSISLNYALGGGDYGVIGASVWSHVPLADDQEGVSAFDANGDLFRGERANKFVEVDPAVNYDLTLGIATFSVGHIWYTDPHEGTTDIILGGQEIDVGPAAPDTAEFYGGIALDVLGQPSLTVYHDYRRFEYQYYALQFSENLDEEMLGDFFGEGFNLTPYALFGFATSADEVYNDKSGLKHVNVGVRSTMFLGNIRVTPILQYNFGTDDALNGIERTDNDFVFGIDFAIDSAFAL